MTVLIATLSRLLLVALVVVLLYRNKYRYCYSFAVYLATQMAVSIVGGFWPVLYQTWSDWADKETLYALLRLLILAELAMLIFRALPRARRRAQLLLLLATLLLAIALRWLSDNDSAYVLAREITSRFSYVTVWGLISLLLLVVWYRVPLLPFHKAILHGMLWLLLIHFAAVWAVGLVGGPAAGHIYNTAQLGILALWLRAAWLRDPPSEGDELAVIRYLQPWRAT
jgi:hypothetical protein